MSSHPRSRAQVKLHPLFSLWNQHGIMEKHGKATKSMETFTTPQQNTVCAKAPLFEPQKRPWHCWPVDWGRSIVTLSEVRHVESGFDVDVLCWTMSTSKCCKASKSSPKGSNSTSAAADTARPSHSSSATETWVHKQKPLGAIRRWSFAENVHNLQILPLIMSYLGRTD